MIIRSRSWMISNGNGRNMIRGTPEETPRHRIVDAAPREEVLSPLLRFRRIGGCSGGGNGARPAAASASRAACTASSPSSSSSAPCAIQIPERSGLPSAVRGGGRAPSADAAGLRCATASWHANAAATSGASARGATHHGSHARHRANGLRSRPAVRRRAVCRRRTLPSAPRRGSARCGRANRRR